MPPSFLPSDEVVYTKEIADLAKTAKAWPFEQARALLKKRQKIIEKKGRCIFETGYGPSGLPHIGTFGEVARTMMVQHAFRSLTQDTIPTQLICFSDDMDGLRKIPDNVPHPERMRPHLGKPLSAIPDPFSSDETIRFGAANNARLRHFLDQFGFVYDFKSATALYKSGTFDEALLRMLALYDTIMEIILPTLGPERCATYAPFLPLCPHTGVVLQVPLIERCVRTGTVVYEHPRTREKIRTPVTGGHVKCQWKADWALRWFALGVDYEMSGKDLYDSVILSSRICKALGVAPPEGLSYELFLDENGQKISKSKGNGLTIEQWLTYADPESLSYYMFQKPKTAKRLSFDIIPKAVDQYHQLRQNYPSLSPAAQLESPLWHIHKGMPPEEEIPISFSLLLNLVSASNAHTSSVLWGFISRYKPEVSPQTHPGLDRLVMYAIRYFENFILPKKVFKIPDAVERDVLKRLYETLQETTRQDAQDIQGVIYDIGRATPRFQNFEKRAPDGRPGVDNAFFSTLYALLLGQTQGPRLGSFIALYGKDATCSLIREALERK